MKFVIVLIKGGVISEEKTIDNMYTLQKVTVSDNSYIEELILNSSVMGIKRKLSMKFDAVNSQVSFDSYSNWFKLTKEEINRPPA